MEAEEGRRIVLSHLLLLLKHGKDCDIFKRQSNGCDAVQTGNVLCGSLEHKGTKGETTQANHYSEAGVSSSEMTTLQRASGSLKDLPPHPAQEGPRGKSLTHCEVNAQINIPRGGKYCPLMEIDFSFP